MFRKLLLASGFACAVLLAGFAMRLDWKETFADIRRDVVEFSEDVVEAFVEETRSDAAKECDRLIEDANRPSHARTSGASERTRSPSSKSAVRPRTRMKIRVRSFNWRAPSRQ